MPNESPSPARAVLPVCDLRPQIAELRAELDVAIDRVVDRGWFILGEECRSFEAEFANYVGTKHVIGVANGTDALHLSLRALGVGVGDRVLTQPNSANPTAAAITSAGATPEFVDVDPMSGEIDLDAVADRLSRGGIAALMPVHLYGRLGGIETLIEVANRYGVPVLEDAAQAHGARRNGRAAGVFGRLGAFSFYPSKNLGAFGDGGAITTDDPQLDERLRLLRNYGQADRYRHVSAGINSRLDELQAAVLRVKLPYLERWNSRRREIARIYDRAFEGLPIVAPPPAVDEQSVHHLYVVRVAHRQVVRERLLTAGIGSEIHYPAPIHLQPAYTHLELPVGSFPHAERRAEQILSLPLFPEMTAGQVEQVVDALRAALAAEPHPTEVTA